VRYNRSTIDPATRACWEAAIAAFFRTRTRAQIRDEGRRRGINACVVEEPGDVLADPHLRARGFWSNDDGIEAPSRFARFTAAAVTAPPRPPTVGARGGPLSGVRVLDFSWALVGSISTKILGDLGADVIKIESRNRPCLSRLDVQVGASRPDDLDDKPWFAHLNTSKRSLALDLKRAESRELLEPLLGWADVVLENFSPGTMDKLGLGYVPLSAEHPGLVMASGSVYGQTGPLAREWGVDGTGGALSGRTFLTGWSDRDPVVPGAVPYGDVVMPYVIAACTVAGLTQRLRGGPGCHVDAAMYEVCAQQMAAAVRAAQQGRRPQRSGNADAAVLHQDVYPARGDDRWVAISAFDEADLARLRELAGNRPIADWTREREDLDIVATLQREGIAAGVVQDIEDLMERDPSLRERGTLVDLPHPKLGSFGHMRTPITFSADPAAPYRAPALGEHTHRIALELAGVSAERLAALERLGVLQ
jgi:crotonobetainyl-CoA:carnitine CoA-transferase CaiB-like acyl-CoA transferase